MDENQNNPRQGRENFVTFMLLAIIGGAFFFFLNLVAFNVFFWVIVVLLGMVGLGYFHYALWGYSLSKEVAGERRIEELKEQMRDEPPALPTEQDEHIYRPTSTPARREERYYRRRD